MTKKRLLGSLTAVAGAALLASMVGTPAALASTLTGTPSAGLYIDGVENTASFVGNFQMSNGDRAYCLEIDLIGPNGPSTTYTDAGLTNNFVNVEGAPIGAQETAALSWIMQHHGETSDNESAAAVQMAVWMLSDGTIKSADRVANGPALVARAEQLVRDGLTNAITDARGTVTITSISTTEAQIRTDIELTHGNGSTSQAAADVATGTITVTGGTFEDGTTTHQVTPGQTVSILPDVSFSGQTPVTVDVDFGSVAVGNALRVYAPQDGAYQRLSLAAPAMRPITVNAEATIQTDLSHGAVEWNKLDGTTSELLAGSEWTITGDALDEPLVVTDNGERDLNVHDGGFAVYELPFGTYTLTESKAPAGYERLEEEIPFTIERGIRTVSLGDFMNTRIAGELAWTKIDASTKHPLAGSEWTLTPETGDALAIVDNGALDTDERDGYLRVVGLEWGTYTLTEAKAPSGYVLDKTTHDVVIDAEIQLVDLGALTNTAETITVTTTKAGLAETGTDLGNTGTVLALASALLVAGTGALLLRRKHATPTE